ncbi:MAG TPA: FtsX-like permease family protein, partial [Mycobacteriales bacterium]|nr:FtsX-like permease family protein [Mycobacteriales bacterium]
PRVAQRLQAVVGDVLEVARPAGGTVTLRVTGVVVPRPEAQGPLGDAVVVHPAQVAELSQVEPTLSGYVVAAPGAAESLLADLSTRLEVIARETPDEIRNLDDLGHLPEILAAALAAVAAAGLAHALLTAARRHAREVAVLSVLGATPRQVRAALAVLALALVLPALAVGIPVGLGVARVLWWQLATATGVGGDLAVPAGSLAVLGPVVVAVALLLALVPARRTAPPAVALAGG